MPGCQGGHKVSLLLALVLTSTTFAANATVPKSMIALPCGGENRPPQLQWSNGPKSTVSLALVLHDPDAPHAGGFYHWIAYGFGPEDRVPTDTGLNDTGSTGYFGPCPPPGKLHHYNFTLYALDTSIASAQPLTAASLLDRMRGHILAKATLTGTLER
jgi:Raf kinase inhibitor-like YbhB/YbcL family protein